MRFISSWIVSAYVRDRESWNNNKQVAVVVVVEIGKAVVVIGW